MTSESRTTTPGRQAKRRPESRPWYGRNGPAGENDDDDDDDERMVGKRPGSSGSRLKFAIVALSFVVAQNAIRLALNIHPPPIHQRDGGGDATEHLREPIRQISLIGERNSGTNWAFDHISECFSHGIKVDDRLTRHKHWFQYENPKEYLHNTLVLAQFRNPYDWFKAMERVPHHSPAHLRLKKGAKTTSKSAENDWRIFLTKPWTMERIGADLSLSGNELCQEDFQFRDVISCVVDPLPKSHYNHTIRYSENQPLYEMRNDGSGRPYDNILELRTDKIRNFLSVAKYQGVSDVWAIQYEYLLRFGTQDLLDRIKEYTGVTPLCQALPPQTRKRKKSRTIDREFAAHIRKNLNWTVEKLIGYQVNMRLEA